MVIRLQPRFRKLADGSEGDFGRADAGESLLAELAQQPDCHDFVEVRTLVGQDALEDHVTARVPKQVGGSRSRATDERSQMLEASCQKADVRMKAANRSRAGELPALCQTEPVSSYPRPWPLPRPFPCSPSPEPSDPPLSRRPGSCRSQPLCWPFCQPWPWFGRPL